MWPRRRPVPFTTAASSTTRYGEAETGPLATSWHSNKFLNPARDGALLPIMHLNGYKIANPTVLARIGHEELDPRFIPASSCETPG
jgi:phosphoketolase